VSDDSPTTSSGVPTEHERRGVVDRDVVAVFVLPLVRHTRHDRLRDRDLGHRVGHTVGDERNDHQAVAGAQIEEAQRCLVGRLHDESYDRRCHAVDLRLLPGADDEHPILGHHQLERAARVGDRVPS